MSNARVLVVEDEPDIAGLLEIHLAKKGYRPRIAGSGRDALEQIKADPPDLVLLDIMLPDVDGIEVCRRIRKKELTRHIPIIFVSAKGEESDVVSGLELGGDDYITKPFSPAVMLARVEAVLRRGRPAEGPDMTVLGGGRLSIDPQRHVVTVDGEQVELTLTQFKILEYLALRPGFVRTRSQIVGAVHGEGTVLSSRAVDVHVAALRQRLGDLGHIIDTVRGVGYRIREDAARV